MKGDKQLPRPRHASHVQAASASRLGNSARQGLGLAEVRGDCEAVARSCERRGGWQGKRRGLGRDPWGTAIGQRARAGGWARGLQSSGLAATVLRVCAVGLAFHVLPPAWRGLGVPGAEQDDGAQGRGGQSRAEYCCACGGAESRACARQAWCGGAKGMRQMSWMCCVCMAPVVCGRGDLALAPWLGTRGAGVRGVRRLPRHEQSSSMAEQRRTARRPGPGR
jgi:hypothetical protein